MSNPYDTHDEADVLTQTGRPPGSPSQPPTGLRPVRERRARPEMDAPRVAIWKDLLAAQRAFLMDDNDEPVQRRGLVPGTSDGLPEMQAAAYTYSRNDRFVTEGMGYGELVTERLMKRDGTNLTPVIRQSRRTTTGRQTLQLTNEHGEPIPESGGEAKRSDFSTVPSETSGETNGKG